MTVRDMRLRAEGLISPEAWDYLETGVGGEAGLGRAENAWKSWRFRPRVLRDVSTISTSCTLLGDDLETPILVAPTACHRAYHPEGELATAKGARESGSLLCLSTRSTTPLEDVAAEAGPWWMQIYVTADRGITEEMVGRAVESGSTALVLTGDTPYVSRRARGGEAGPVPEEVAMANVREHMEGRSIDDLVADPSITPAAINWLAELSGLPVLVKGVVRADDAQSCVDAGAAGVIVSNHGARQIDGTIETARALPEVVSAVGRQVPVLVDGGIRTGADVAIGLALGAAAVLIGRPAIYGLACNGAAGVAEVVNGLTAEAAEVMGLLGSTCLADLDRSLVTPYSDALAGG